MEIVFGDLSLGVRKGGASYIFAYNLGGIESLEKDGNEYLYRAPSLAFWRATTDNDRGNGFSKRSALWMGADAFSDVEGYEVEIDGREVPLSSLIAPGNNELISSPLRKADNVSIVFHFRTCTAPSASVSVRYSLEEDKDGVKVDYSYKGVPGLPELPVCGLRFILPFKAEAFEWDGLSGETYPDRLYGAVRGHYRIEGLPLCPYAMVQEYGMHMHTSELGIKCGNKELCIKAESDDGFSFSLLPASPMALENAYHNIDLPPQRYSYLTIAAAVRGVGGIDSWGSDVGKDAHIDSSGSYSVSFRII